mmetsp:Transcript_15648/g.54222  ORF Transcript_15648/g.54222 Transcript_15648/m.54222 type:complete len:349 (-) Transcript_15648:1-1047(-)
MRSTLHLPAASTMGPMNSASFAASSSESLTSRMSVAASMSVRRRAGRASSASMSPRRSSGSGWRLDGTSFLRRSSSAAWMDHASMPSASASAAKASGDGPTVEIVIFDRAMRNLSPSTSDVAAALTWSTLRPASPMPMKTMFVSGGMASDSRATFAARANCARISSAVSWRTSPIRAVAQKRQPRSQPTCDDTQSVVRGRVGWGINTASTARPSANRTRSFVVPSFATCVSASVAGTKRVAPQAIKARRAPMVTRSESRGSSPARTASQTDRARPAPPTSSLSSGKGKASVDDGRPWTSMPGGAAVRGTVAESAEAEARSARERHAWLRVGLALIRAFFARPMLSAGI